MADLTDLESMFADVQIPGQEVPQPAPAPVAPPVAEAPQPVAPPPVPTPPPVVPQTPPVVPQPAPIPEPVVAPTPVQQVVEATVPQVPVAPVTPAAQPTIPQATQSTLSASQVPSTMQSNTAVADKVPDDFSIDLPENLKSQLIEAGADIGEIGMKVSRVPIEKYRASASKIDRIGFITTKVIPVKMHYIEGKGSIMCFHGKCCELQGNPSVRYLFPIAVYQTDAEGNVSGGKVQLMMLSAGEDLYKTIQTLHKGSASMGGIDHVDLLVTCTDEKYQKLSLVQAGPAIWRSYRQIAEFLASKWKADGDKAYMAVARKVDESSFMKMLDMDVDDDKDQAPQQFDPSVNQDLSKFFS